MAEARWFDDYVCLKMLRLWNFGVVLSVCIGSWPGVGRDTALFLFGNMSKKYPRTGGASGTCGNPNIHCPRPFAFQRVLRSDEGVAGVETRTN